MYFTGLNSSTQSWLATGRDDSMDTGPALSDSFATSVPSLANSARYGMVSAQIQNEEKGEK